MSPDNVDIAFGTPEDGKVKFTAGPNAVHADAKTFFMKVRGTIHWKVRNALVDLVVFLLEHGWRIGEVTELCAELVDIPP